MEANLLDKTLTDYQERKVPVTLVLQNRAKVSGTIRTFDSYVIIIDSHKAEIVYRHAISSLAPASAVLPARTTARPQAKTAVRQPAPKQAGGTAREPKGPVKPAARQKSQKPHAPAVPTAEPSLNTGMKEGLQRWLQGQKAK